MFKHILLATDGSDIAAHAAAFAVDLARLHGAKLTALLHGCSCQRAVSGGSGKDTIPTNYQTKSIWILAFDFRSTQPAESKCG